MQARWTSTANKDAKMPTTQPNQRANPNKDCCMLQLTGSIPLQSCHDRHLKKPNRRANHTAASKFQRLAFCHWRGYFLIAAIFLSFFSVCFLPLNEFFHPCGRGLADAPVISHSTTSLRFRSLLGTEGEYYLTDLSLSLTLTLGTERLRVRW